MARPTVLITISFSHFCEKARWALARARIPYDERARLPLYHMIETVPRGGRATPMLDLAGQRLTDSTDILKALDAHLLPADRLYPDDPTARREVEALEDRFDSALGPATRYVAYSHILPAARTLLPWLLEQGGPLERATLPLILPLWTAAMMKGLKIHPSRYDRQVDKIQTVFDEVGARLADGRRYLVADRFTAADLTFAALSAPLLRPPVYRDRLMAEALVPEAFQRLVNSWSDHPAMEFAHRIYEVHRPQT